jgi:sugar phosphate isomerase/epimerase
LLCGISIANRSGFIGTPYHGEAMAQLCLNLFNESGFFGHVPDFAGQIRAAAAAGFDAVGPDVYSLARYREAGGRIEDVAELIAEHGLQCPEIAALMVNTDRAEVDAQLALFEPAVRALRPRWILVNSDVSPGAASAALLRHCAERLGALGARLAVEYLAMMRVNSIASALELIERAGVADAGVLVDTWHFFLGPVDGWSDLECLPRERLAYVQFDDHPPLAGSDLREETLHRRVFPGEGTFELERFCRELRARGFDGLVSVEVLSKQWRGGDLDAFARRAYQSTARYWR